MSSNNVTPTTSPVKPKKPINPIRNKPLHASPTRPSASKRAVTISADNESAFQLASVDVTCSNIQSNSNNHTGDNNQHAIHDLTEQLNQMFAKHAEERYWWNLEREKMQHDKQMLQDRLHKLLHVPQDDNLQRSLRPLPQSLNEVQELVQSLEQQEKMVRLLHAQVSLVQSAGDATVKTYKDELAALMATKTLSQVHWTNQIAQLENERDHLRVQLQAAEQQQKSVIDAAPPPPPVVERALAAAPSSNEVKRLQKELHRLKKDYSKLNAELTAEKRHAKSAIDQATQDRKDLATQVEQLQSQLTNAHSTNAAMQLLEQVQQDREEAMETLEHVASMWEKAGSTMQQLDGVIQALTPNNNQPVSDEHEQVLSTVETAALIHGQIKVSLMLIELKLRNNLSCLQNDKVYVGIKPDDEALLERLDTIQDDAMTAIEQVQNVLEEQLDRLVEAAGDQENDDDDDDDATDDDGDDDAATDDNDGGDSHVPDDYSERRRRNAQHSSRRSNHRRLLLGDKMSEYGNDYSREETADDGTVQHFVSTRVMETLQDEVSHMLESLQEKNSEVAHLKSTVDELTVRERSLMHELRRVMGEQAKIEAAERQRRMEALKALDTDTDDDDGDPSSDDNEDDAGSGFASSVEFSDEDADYDEITYYEEVIE